MKNFTLFCLIVGMTLVGNSLFAFEITSPSMGSTMQPGTAFRINWSVCDSRVVAYDYKVKIVGVQVNSDGQLEPYTFDNSGSTTDDGTCTRAPDRFSKAYNIPCNVISGTMNIIVSALSKVCGGDYYDCSTATSQVIIQPAVAVTPPPQALINCKPGHSFEINAPSHLDGYKTVWYDAGGHFLKEGDQYSSIFPPGITRLQYWYIPINPNCSNDNLLNVQGLKSQVVIYTFDLPATSPVALAPVSLEPDPDPRAAQNQPCTNPGTFFVLPGDDAITDLITDNIDVLTTTFSDVLASTNHASYTTVSVQLKPHVEWIPNDTYGSPYQEMPGGSKQVCYANLNPAPDGCRSYTARISFKVKITFSETVNNGATTLLNQNTENDCIVLDLFTLTICQNKLCKMNQADADYIYKPNPTNNPNSEYVIICNPDPYNSPKLIGPQDPLYVNKSFSLSNTGSYVKYDYDFHWYGGNKPYSAKGLSNILIRNPQVNYATIPIPAGAFYKYFLEIKETLTTRTLPPEMPNDPSQKETYNYYYWGTVVYKCKWCEAGQRPNPGDQDVEAYQMETGLENSSIEENDFKLYPNPAQEQVSIEFLPLAAERWLSIYDALGKELKRLKIPAGLALLSMDLSDLKKGFYLCHLHSESGIITSKKLLVY